MPPRQNHPKLLRSPSRRLWKTQFKRLSQRPREFWESLYPNWKSRWGMSSSLKRQYPLRRLNRNPRRKPWRVMPPRGLRNRKNPLLHQPWLQRQPPRPLELSDLDEDTRIALHYELASAYETAADKLAALTHYMEVYGSNIDYRDVSERIKALKS